tara:strand:- start:154 stop:324 length:171 start_codon:yes stop_codon:yes gene_type:complete
MEEKPIMWGWNRPERARSEEHRKFLISEYNKDKPEDQHVSTMDELEKALIKEKENQ